MVIITTINTVWRIWPAVYLKKNLNDHHEGDQWVVVSPVLTFVNTQLITLVAPYVIQDKQGRAWITKSAYGTMF